MGSSKIPKAEKIASSDVNQKDMSPEQKALNTIAAMGFEQSLVGLAQLGKRRLLRLQQLERPAKDQEGQAEKYDTARQRMIACQELAMKIKPEQIERVTGTIG